VLLIKYVQPVNTWQADEFFHHLDLETVFGYEIGYSGMAIGNPML
jgi:hypothetical protein